MAEPDLTDKVILEALNTSGYLLEQEVATELEQLGFFVETNVAFTDSEEGKSRETDIVGFRKLADEMPANISAGVQVICECKNSKNPYFFVTRPKNSMDARHVPLEFVFPMREVKQVLSRSPDGKETRYKSLDPFHHYGLDRFHHYYTDINKAVQFGMLIKKQNKWTAEHAHIFDGIFMPLIKAFNEKRSSSSNLAFQYARRDTPTAWIRAIIPLVVVNSDLFVIDSSVSPPRVSTQPYVAFLRDIQTNAINGRFMVIFVRAGQLRYYFDEVLAQVTNEIVRMAKDDPNTFFQEEVEQLAGN